MNVIEAHLCLLLMQYDVVSNDDVCWWDSARAVRACEAAGLRRVDDHTWTHTEQTAEWMSRTWSDIRSCA